MHFHTNHTQFLTFFKRKLAFLTFFCNGKRNIFAEKFCNMEKIIILSESKNQMNEDVPDVLPEKPYKKEYMDGYKMRAFMLARYGIMIHSNVVYRRELNYTDSECANLECAQYCNPLLALICSMADAEYMKYCTERNLFFHKIKIIKVKKVV